MKNFIESYRVSFVMARLSPFIFFKMAFLSLRRHPIRSGLALLGIVIGIASMAVTMALGEGANETLRKEILAMGENWIYIMPGNFISKGEVRRTRKQEKNLSYEDYLAINQFSSNIQACTPCVEKKEVVKYQSNQLVAEIQGLNADFFRIEPRGIKIGLPFSAHHDNGAIPVAVLGSEVAKELLIAASVSLVVGGIGIMNIMLVAMTERRKEIGIKMALGATAGHILFQFLIESVLLCLSGGIVGILIGVGGAYLLGTFTEFEWALRETPLIIAFVTTVVVGLFFGFYPAYKASKLNPVEALQSI